MSTTIWLTLAVATTGLWSGLLLTVTTLLHPMFAEQDDTGFVTDLRRFLPIARRSPTNYVLVISMVVAPVGAVWAMRGEGSSAAVALTVAGLVLVLVGAVAVSRWLAEPNYDAILGWDAAYPQATIRIARRRYFTFNWLRAALVWSAFACFLLAGLVDA